ncbi:MAG: hypothetical protein ACLQU5_14180 [Isosphaeraceae bacterium]
MRTNVCKHCHESVGTTDPAVTTCGRCAGITAGCWVRSCEGITGQVVHARHSGGFIVELTYGTRQFSGSQLRARKRLIVANGTSERPDTVMTMAGV